MKMRTEFAQNLRTIWLYMPKFYCVYLKHDINWNKYNCMAPIFAADMKVFALNTTVYPSNKKYICHKYEIKLYLAQKNSLRPKYDLLPQRGL